jgi:uncharacterized protein
MRANEVRGEVAPDGRAARVVGRVVELWRYPVKSMAGEALVESEVARHGVAGDRRWAFVRPGLERSNFPWLTIREQPALVHYRPRFAEPERPDHSPTLVRTPEGAELEVVDPALAAALGEGVRVIKQNRGVFDTAPLSLISRQTLESLSALAGAPLSALRFRPNLVIDAAVEEARELDAFPEDHWVGATLHVGDPARGLVMRVDERDPRCVMVNVDPATGERNPAVLRAIASQRQACLGVYGTTVQPGRISVGDLVTLTRSS